MKKTLILITFSLPILFISCKKTDLKTKQNMSLIGRWTLIESLADPGDGTGKWKKVDKPNYYFIQFNKDSTIQNNMYTASGELTHFKVSGSNIKLIYADSNTLSLFYKLERCNLTLQGGCYEPCGTKYKK